MNGTITFDSAKSLAEFLKEFAGGTALFTVVQEGDKFVLTFDGGY